MAHSLRVCSSIWYPWRDVPLQFSPILSIFLCKASICIPNSSLSSSVESPFLSVSVLSCSVQTTTLQLRLAQELTKVTSCIWQGALLCASVSQPYQDHIFLEYLWQFFSAMEKLANLPLYTNLSHIQVMIHWKPTTATCRTWYPAVLGFPPT